MGQINIYIWDRFEVNFATSFRNLQNLVGLDILAKNVQNNKIKWIKHIIPFVVIKKNE